jgi:site-specific recombinase XerD
VDSFSQAPKRNGGDIYFLSRILGHSSVKTKEIYLKSLGIEELQAVHNKFSILGARNG